MESIIKEGNKVRLFSQFVRKSQIFKQYLEKQERKFAYLDGATTRREAEVQRFKEDKEMQVFLISIKAGGVGLNLTEADYVFILDPWWNPAVEQQAIDRTHRIGQKKNVFIYKFITKDSIEEKIIALQGVKNTLQNRSSQLKNPLSNHCSPKDIQELFN